MKTQPPADLIEADVLVDHRVIGDDVGFGVAAPRARRAAHLEDVGEVGAEAQAEGRIAGDEPVVGDDEAFVAGAVPQEPRAPDVQAALGERDVAFDQHVGVGQVDRALLVVAGHFRTEEERAFGADAELEEGEEAGVVAIEPLLAARLAR